MSELIPLSAVLDKDRSKTPILPFLATYDGEPYTVRGLFGRSAELQARDGYKLTLRQESIRVNPDHLHWPINGEAEPQEEKIEMAETQERRPHRSEGKLGKRISLEEAAALKAQGLKRCWKCKRDMPIAELNSGGMCRDGKACAAAKEGLPVPLADPSTASQTSATIPLPIKRSVKAKALRRGKKKRKYTRRRSMVKTAPIKSVAKSHANGHALTAKELLDKVAFLKKEQAIALKTIDALQAENAGILRQLQEILA